jgi:predicted PP-loop superfamily ATPase
MTLAELRAIHGVAYKIIGRQRKFWAEVADKGNARALEKMRECDRLLEILTKLKDELKVRLEREPVQPRLLDAPKRASYE